MDEIPKNSGADLAGLDYLRGVESSTCLLLSSSPSPTPLDFKHPLSDQINEEPFLTLEDDPTNVQNHDSSAGDSSSGDSTSVVQDPVSAQLINNISMLEYQTLSKNGDIMIGQNEDSKLNGSITASNRKLPNFVNWNWIVIRKVLLWFVLSCLVACLAAIIAMVVTIPKTCNPDLPWYQGKVFYEVFPASFKDSNGDGFGDLKGLTKKLNYINDLGVSAIRLNHIFEANEYPEHYYNVTSLFKIARNIGTLKDFQELVQAVHALNMSIVLDLPVASMASPTNLLNSNKTSIFLLSNDSLINNIEATTAAIKYWVTAQNVDGIYLKNLERFTDDPQFGSTLQMWKELIGYGKILMASEAAYKKAKGDARNVLLSRIDLIDVHLNLSNGIGGLKQQINDVLTGDLWSKPHYPWVHWNIGDLNSDRVATKFFNNTLTLSFLQFILPGTVSVFYGDEIGLVGISTHEVEKDFHEHELVRNLVLMNFEDDYENEQNAVLSWISKSNAKPNYHNMNILKNLIKLRINTPTIYLRAIFKDGNILRNADIRDTENNLVVIERWFPRRNTVVFVGNLGGNAISTDLSTMFYGGLVVAGTNSSQVGEILYFDKITFPPYSAVILKLEK